MAHKGGPIIIVELGARWLKMARVEYRRSRPVISQLHTERHDGDLAAVPNMIEQAVVRLNIANEPIITYLPRQVVNIRLLNLPSSDPQEVADMVDLQVGKQTPYSRDEIISGYKIVGTDSTGYTRVLLAIVQRSVVRQRFAVLENSGLDIARMSISTEGVLNWYLSGGVDPPQTLGAADVIIDIDSAHSDLLIIADNQPVFTRSILVGADEMGSDFEQWSARFIQEVGRSLEIYRGENARDEPKRLLLTGAGLHVRELIERMDQQFDLEVEGLISTRNVEISDDLIVPEGVSLTPLIGLALVATNVAFNMVPDAVQVRRTLEARARTLTLTGVLVIAILFALSVACSARIYFKDTLLERLKDEQDRIQGPASDVSRKERAVEWWYARLDSGVSPARVLAELHRQIIPEVHLERIDFEYGERPLVTLIGIAQSRSDRKKFERSLVDSLLFENVLSKNISSVQGTPSKVRFVTECILVSSEGGE